MSERHWGLFPYPTITANGVTDGALMAAHPDCITCRIRPCMSETHAPRGEPSICRFGLTYARIDETRIVAGVVTSDLSSTQRSRKRVRAEQERRVKSADVRNAIQRAVELGDGVVVDFELARESAVRRMSEDEELHRAVAQYLKKDFDETLNQSHDFLQLVKLVKGHAEALLYEKHPELTPELAAERLPTEGAIFFSTELMLVKMDSLTFLREANLALGGERRFRIHPLVLKYVRIYRWQAAQKNVEIQLHGECYAECFYNNSAMGAVIQGLIDNMVKYSPSGSTAHVYFEEHGGAVNVAFVSLGPRIEASETEQIFLPGFRGAAAREMEADGLGVGLASAKAISDVLDLSLRVEQGSTPDGKYANRYMSSFAITLQRTK